MKDYGMKVWTRAVRLRVELAVALAGISHSEDKEEERLGWDLGTVRDYNVLTLEGLMKKRGGK